MQVKNILIATGAKATKIPIEGNELGIISDEILALEKLPEKCVLLNTSQSITCISSCQECLCTFCYLVRCNARSEMMGDHLIFLAVSRPNKPN